MKKVVSVLLIVMTIFTLTVATANTSEVLTSREASMKCIDMDKKGYSYMYFIHKEDLENVGYVDVTKLITEWNGLYLVSNSQGLIGRYWPNDEPGSLVKKDTTKANLRDAFNRNGELYET